MTRRVWNPPERTALAYRAATRETLFAEMRRLAGEPEIVRAGGPNPLHLLPMIPEDGFVPALLDAWATVGDVLTFYQERIANEGYLRTAAEPFSQRELVRALGRQPRPALSARTVFAFTVATTKGAPAEALVPASTPISAAPPPDGSPPPVFETHDDLLARGEWNAVPLVFPAPRATTLPNGGDAIRLAGDDLTVLKPGAPLVARRRVGGTVSDTVVTLTEVVPDAVTKSAFVRWTPPIGAGAGALQFVAFRSSTGLFGAKAPEWSDQLPAIKARYFAPPGGVSVTREGASWSALTDGAPKDANVTALRFGGGELFALTPRAVLRARGASWIALDPRARGDLCALATAGTGVYAASTRGEVVVSYDRGASWAAVGTPASGASPLAGIAVHALAVRAAAGSVPVVFAGTDRGVAFARDDGSGWTFVNAGLGGVDADKKTAPVAVTSLALRGTTLLAASSEGVATRELDPNGEPSARTRWTPRPVVASTAPAAPAEPITAVAFGDTAAYAASTAGVFVASADWSWTRVAGATGAPLDASGASVIAAAPNGAAVSHDRGATWTGVGATPPVAATAVAVDGANGAAYAVPLADFPPDWPHIGLDGTGVDVERLVPTLAPGAQVALVDTASPAPPSQAARIVSAQTVRRRDFQQTGLVTHVELTALDANAPLHAFGRRTTRLYYDARVFGGAPDPVPQLQPVAGTSLTIDATLTPFPPGRMVALSGRPVRARVVGLAGGVRRIDATGAGTAWGLRGLDARAIAAAPDGTVYVATSQGVWRRPPQADFAPWTEPVHATQALPAMRTIAASTSVVVGADETGAVYRRAPADDAWSSVAGVSGVRAVLPAADGATLWAGGSAGLARSDDGTGWRPVLERGAPGTAGDASAVNALAWAADGATLLAGTSNGVAVRAPDGTWGRSLRGLDNRTILSLAVSPTTWWAGTDGGGVYASHDAGATWTLVPLAIAPGLHSVRALAFDGVLYAAVRGYGVVRDGLLVDAGIGNDVRGLLVRPDGVLAAVRSGTVLASRSFVEQVIALRDLGVVEIGYADDLNRGSVPPGLRTDLATLMKVQLPAKAALQTVGSGEWLVSGEGVDDLLLREAPARVNIIVASVRSFVVAAPPAAAADGTRTWSVRSGDDVATFVAREADVAYASARADDPLAGEVLTVASTTMQRETGVTAVAFAHPLGGVYDGRTVQLLGNCVDGSHGASSPTYEAIGNGDASQANQEFVLARRGLTTLLGDDGAPAPQINVVVRAAVPRSAIASAGDLRREEMETAGVPWTRFESLADAGPTDRAFAVLVDDEVTTVQFGDGVNGSRLPTGNENVVARYRTGNGPSGNIAAESQLLLRRRAGGVNGVRNPVAATGGLLGEPPSDAVAAAHAGLRTLERVVSLADLEDFAVARTGIAKAKLRIVPGRKPVAHLTLAGENGDDVDAATKKNLLFAIRHAGGGAMPVVLHDPRRRFVRIAAELRALPGLDPAEVAAAAVARVRNLLAFEHRELGEGIVAARVIEVLQDAPGVLSVTLQAFHDAAWSAIVAPAILGEDALSPTSGELLVLLDPDPSTLTVTVTA